EGRARERHPGPEGRESAEAHHAAEPAPRHRGPCDARGDQALMARLTWRPKLPRLRRRPSILARREKPVIHAMAPTPLSADTRLLVWQRDGGCCRSCGSFRFLHFDHIIPVSWGGASNAENVELL